MICNIALDGPAGAGKSTIAKMTTKELSFIYVDTGAMYRAMALYLTRQGITPEEADKIPAACNGADITIKYVDGVQIVLLNDENVNAYLRTEEVSKMASVSSAVKEVRARLLDLQRSLAAKQSVVMDGRDIGTTILPNAQVKIFLTASSETRAMRRLREYEGKGDFTHTFDEIHKEIIDRDYRDVHRDISPLKQAEDAVLVDSSYMNLDEVVQAILNVYKAKMA